MQAPNPQGILGLMAQGRAPQQPQQPQQPQMQPQMPMPSPNKASPMAGLGSVEDRVAAYRGNPAPLQQRYAMSQDLLDLLALQKIKSEKDAAARQMQMQMAQQQAAQGQMPTVAQQREKEVMELTKNELAQQQAEQAPPPQQLMGGIAAAPGAAAAAQPKMMASGGIVAFADGGFAQEGDDPTGDDAFAQEGGDYDPAPGTFDMFMPSEEISEPQGEVEIPPELRGTGKLGLSQVIDIKRGKYGRTREEILRAFGMAPTPQPAAPAAKPAAPAAPAAPSGIAAAPGVAPTPPQFMPSTRSSEREGISGISIPNKIPSTPSDDLASRMRARAGEQMDRDRINEQLREEQRVEERLRLTPEQRKVYEEGIAGLRQMYDKQYDPEYQRRQGLIRALIGAGGRAYGELGAAAGAGIAYDDAQNAQRRRDFLEMQKAREGLVGLDREAVKSGITAGATARSEAEAGVRAGMTAAGNLYQVDSQSRDNFLARQIQAMQARAQAEANRLTKEGFNLQKAQTLLLSESRALENLERQYKEDFNEVYGMLLTEEQQQGDKMRPEKKAQLDAARVQLKIDLAKIKQNAEPVLNQLRQQLGLSSSGIPSMTPAQKAAMEKYSR